MSSAGGADERTQLLFFPLSTKSRDLGRGERGRHFRVLSRLELKLGGLGSLLEADFAPKSIMHDPYLSLGMVMSMLLEIV